jgi:hypothetical protein
VANFLFDDEKWAIRHLVVETGHFFDERRVLISPISFRTVDWARRLFHLGLTMDEVRKSPGVDTDQPVSRQHERDYYDYYGYPYYWGAMGVWGTGYYPALMGTRPPDLASTKRSAEMSGDAHLRSVVEVHGYDIEGVDDRIGFATDFIVDDESWEIRYLVVDTSHWWWGKKVLVAPDWATHISWADRTISVDLTREAIKSSPEWDGAGTVPREYEALLYRGYRRPAYWLTRSRRDQARARFYSSTHAR